MTAPPVRVPIVSACSARSECGRHLVEALAFAAGMHPGLGTTAIDLHRGREGGRIVERAGEHERYPRQNIAFGDDARSAIWTEPTTNLLSGVAGVVIGLQFALNVYRRRRKRDDGFKGRSGIALNLP
jgi:hypothetical protein